MAEENQPTRSYKPIYWALVAIAAIALVAWTYVGTKKSDHQVAVATETGQGVGTAYNPTTGQVTGAGATPGALGTGGPQTPSVSSGVVVPAPTPNQNQPASR